MKKLAIALLAAVPTILVGCRREVVVASPPPAAAANVDGAATAQQAVQRFLATAKAQDLQAMSRIWGSSAGPAHATMSKEELEMREIYLMRCLRHDSYAMKSETPAAGGERVFIVEMKMGRLTAASSFTVTKGPGERWYVRTLDVEPLREICTAK